MSYLNDPSQIPHVDASPAGRPYASLSPHLPGMQVMAGFGQTRRFEGTLSDLSSYSNNNQSPYHPGRSNITFQLPGPQQTPIGSFNFDLDIPEIPDGTAGEVHHFLGVLGAVGSNTTVTLPGTSTNLNVVPYSSSIVYDIKTTISGGETNYTTTTLTGQTINEFTGRFSLPVESTIAGSNLQPTLELDEVVKTPLATIVPVIRLGASSWVAWGVLPRIKVDCAS